jgi:hypothetical protein
MKKCLVLFVVLILAWSNPAFPQTVTDQKFTDPGNPYAATGRPVRHLKLNPNKLVIANSIIVLPGQEIVFDNTTFFWVRIFSDLPISFRDGKCFAARTTDLTCEISPNVDVHFQDVRTGSSENASQINRVRFTFMRDAP